MSLHRQMSGVTAVANTNNNNIGESQERQRADDSYSTDNNGRGEFSGFQRLAVAACVLN